MCDRPQELRRPRWSTGWARPIPTSKAFLTAQQVGFAPKAWVTDPNQYTASFAKWNGQNGGAANNVYVRMTGVPFEFADQAPAVKQYMDLVAKSRHDRPAR